MTSVDPETKSCTPKDPTQDTSLGIIANVPLEESHRVRRKVDLILLPLLGFCYFLQFLDKQTLSYASLLGMIEDIHLEGTQFSWVASVFYFGYMFWSYPTMYLSVRLPIGKYLGATVYVLPSFRNSCDLRQKKQN